VSNTRKPKSLRDIARNAKTRVEHYDIPLVDVDECEAAATALTNAKAALRREELAGSAKTAAEAKAAVDTAQKARDACYRRVTFRGLSSKALDTLNNEHPDFPEGEAPEGHVEQVYYIAEASCINGEDMTAEDWKDLCDNVWTAADALKFTAAVWNASTREFTHGIPKG
jgi:hypothetical protein